MVVVAASLTPMFVLLGERLASTERSAASFGAGLAGLNAVLAYGLVRWSHRRRSARSFLAVVLGSMLGRMVVMLAAVVWGILGLGLPRLPLVVALLSYFVVFLVVEISVLQARTSGAEAR